MFTIGKKQKMECESLRTSKQETNPRRTRTLEIRQPTDIATKSMWS